MSLSLPKKHEAPLSVTRRAFLGAGAAMAAAAIAGVPPPASARRAGHQLPKQEGPA